MKRSGFLLITCSSRIVLMATSEKLGTRAPHRVAPIEAVDTLVIEHDADDQVEMAVMPAIDIARAGEPT
jgi:DeoR/GlpR family transcriptional regulator of sugar metabolism